MLTMLGKILAVPLAVTGAGIVLAVAGCGNDPPFRPPRPPSAAVLASDARASFAIAGSVRITGHLRSRGQLLTVDLSLFRSGAMTGTLSNGRVTYRVLRAGDRGYLYLSTALFRYYHRSGHFPAAACARACGRWLRGPGSGFGDLSLRTLSRLIDSNVPRIRNRARITATNRTARRRAPRPRVRLTTFDGQPAWALTAGNAEAFIAEHSGFLLGIAKRGFGLLRFSEWNAVPPVRAPPASQVINVHLPGVSFGSPAG